MLFFVYDGPAESIFNTGAHDVSDNYIDDVCELFLGQRKVRVPGFEDDEYQPDKGGPKLTGC